MNYPTWTYSNRKQTRNRGPWKGSNYISAFILLLIIAGFSGLFSFSLLFRSDADKQAAIRYTTATTQHLRCAGDPVPASYGCYSYFPATYIGKHTYGGDGQHRYTAPDTTYYATFNTPTRGDFTVELSGPNDYNGLPYLVGPVLLKVWENEITAIYPPTGTEGTPILNPNSSDPQAYALSSYNPVLNQRGAMQIMWISFVVLFITFLLFVALIMKYLRYRQQKNFQSTPETSFTP